MLICPDCGSGLPELEPRCGKCGWLGEVRGSVWVLLSKDDRQDPVFARYLDNYDRISRDDLNAPILDLRYVTHQAANLARLVGDVGNADVLDLGCGQGFLTRTLLARGARSVIAVDIAMPYLTQIGRNARVRPVCANAENLPFENAFDVAVSTDVMEHVLNLGAFLYSLNRALRPGGRAFIRVPLNENLLAYAPQIGCRYRFVHLRTFDLPIMRAALTNAGFRFERFLIDGFNLGTPRPFWQNGRRRQRLYTHFQRAVERFSDDPTSVTTWPAWIASMFMKPQELVVAVTKRKRIRPV
ncbi:MAG: class I SAM-dependent methyltransferase, partial [Rubricoccaceae bacterium]|nr:class I SAM-dependent methyltransferase [Rubricoccaceae bacterium]